MDRLEKARTNLELSNPNDVANVAATQREVRLFKEMTSPDFKEKLIEYGK